jgi:ADP-heptose:LPS heptosyltransferase
MHEILVIHPGALGDVLQTVPALTMLREGVPARLAFAGQPRLARLLVDTAVVDEALAFDALGLSHLFVADAVPAPVREWLARFDWAISWFGARDAVYPWALRALIPRVVIAPPVPDVDSPRRVWEHLCSTVEEFTGPASRPTPTLRVPGVWTEHARTALARLNADPARPLLVVHSGAGARWKRWPVDKIARAVAHSARSAPWQVVVHEGPADAEAAADLLTELNRISPGGGPVHLVAPDLGLLAGVLGLAHAYVGADSGVSHLASAVGARAIIVYPTSTVARWAPWSPTATAVAMTADDRDLEHVAMALAGDSHRAGAAPPHAESPRESPRLD